VLDAALESRPKSITEDADKPEAAVPPPAAADVPPVVLKH
jgi:hypothetical protein